MMEVNIKPNPELSKARKSPPLGWAGKIGSTIASVLLLFIKAETEIATTSLELGRTLLAK